MELKTLFKRESVADSLSIRSIQILPNQKNLIERRDFRSINVMNTEPTDLYSRNTKEGLVVFCWESEILIDSVLPG